ncbi:efflux RND transporter permease subunit [Nannocystis pusilla]|uniref:efflux RND transporter permease subunit n=1 Tax=Nannocystis pusilla TaxID=889268 RepID=UPI003DA380E3
MRGIAALCVRRPVFTWVLVLVGVVLGLVGLGKMPIERFPNMNVPFVTVTVLAPGLSAEQVESEVSTRIENALGTVSGVDRLDSISSEGSGVVMVQFVLSKDAMEAANEVRDRVSRLADELPPTARPARIETFNANASPIVLVAVESPSGARTSRELTELADTTIRRELQSISGVGDVRLTGGETRILSIALDPLRLTAADLTPDEVKRSLALANLDVPGGSLVDGESALGVRLSAKARTAEELAQVVIARRGSSPVRLADVARVAEESGISNSRASYSGRPSVIIAVTKQPGANTVGVADEVKERLTAARTFLPDGVEVRVIQDNSEDVRASVLAVAEHLVLGAVLAAVVVLLFLRSWRATLIAGLAIPTSILATFALANALGVTLNLLSLLGLTLAVGIVIDDAIVVVENVVRVMHANHLDRTTAAVRATQEIGLAVLATTLSLVAVFLPVATMEGMVGAYLAPFGLTMSVSILLSMAVAFTLTPMLCSRWLQEPGTQGESGASQEHHGALERAYERALRWLMSRRWLMGVAIAGILLSIIPIGALLPVTFIPVEDMSRFAVYVRLPGSATVEKTALVGEDIASMLRELPDVADTALTTISPREATITALLGRRGVQEERMRQARASLQRHFADDPYLLMVGTADDFAPPGPDSATVQFVVRGADLNELHRVATDLLTAARVIPGTVDHGLSSQGGRPELAVRVDRAHASRLGVSQADIGAALALADREGVELGRIRDLKSKVEATVSMRMRVESESLAQEDLVRALTVRNERGRLVSLSQLAEIEKSEGPGVIRRVGRSRQMTVFMNTTPGTSDFEVIQTLEKRLRELDPDGRFRGEVIGNAREIEKTVVAFLVAIMLSFIFMYLVLAAQFESWLHPVTILMSLPLTVPFGLLSLLVGGQSLNLFSALGFLVLFGVVKKNSILQIDRTIQLREAGVPRDRAVVEASRDRLRPILMTTIAFVAGMLPLVVSSGPGSATNRAIAVGVMGGQTLSLLLTLLATPILYTWFDDLQEWLRTRRRPPARAALEAH